VFRPSTADIAGLDHVLRVVAGGRVEGRAVDVEARLGDRRRQAVARPAEAVEDAAEHLARHAQVERLAAEAHAQVGGAQPVVSPHSSTTAASAGREHLAQVRARGGVHLDQLAVGGAAEALDDEQRPVDAVGAGDVDHAAAPFAPVRASASASRRRCASHGLERPPPGLAPHLVDLRSGRRSAPSP
jgi:hypothetical protein